jgi:glutamyl-tRNA synthetase
MSAIPFTTASGPNTRVRICPSPTGVPHVGLIRTALFNLAYARHTGGKLVFRIEDTDAARDTEENYSAIVDAFRWTGIDWDEGIDVGGPNGPYRQSQRGEIYQRVLQQLKDAGHLYESFSTPEEIEARNLAAGRPVQQGYDNADRETTDEQKAAYRAEGRQPSWRLRVPDLDLSFTDLVRGDITFPAGSTVDFVVVRPNGDPLYTFVNPVDDALMGITHVLRGEDILPSTPRQIALYLALIEIGVTDFVPLFGHLPVILGEGTKKLSKRNPESNLFHHRDRGLIPEGLVNYLALLGWSLAPDRDVFSQQEMFDAFDVVDVQPNPARFDQKKAESINGDHIRLLEVADFAQRLVPYLGELFDPLNGEHQRLLHGAAPLVQERMQVLSEARDLLAFLFTTDEALEFATDALPDASAVAILDAAGAALGSLPTWTAAEIEAACRRVLIEGLELKPRVAFGPLRTAISGRRVSPPLFESMELLGEESTLARIAKLRARL